MLLKLKDLSKKQLGAIGECQVTSLLIQNGWDAFNTNVSIPNYPSADIICVRDSSKNSEKSYQKETAFIQVKTCKVNNVPIGLTIKDCLSKEILEQKVVGPWVILSVKETFDGLTFRFFVLSRRQFIDLAYEGHQFYMHGYHRNGKQPSVESLAGLNISWLEGKDEIETKRHIRFINPLKGVSTEDEWDNIWIED